MEALHTERGEIALIQPLCDCVDGGWGETPGLNSLCGGKKKKYLEIYNTYFKNIPAKK